MLNFHRYLYIKGLHDREEVLAARLAVLDYILNTGQGKLDLEKAWEAGVLDVRCGRGCLPFMEVSVTTNVPVNVFFWREWCVGVQVATTTV